MAPLLPGAPSHSNNKQANDATKNLSVEGDGIITGNLKVGSLTATSSLTISGTGTTSIAGYLDVAKGLEVGTNGGFVFHENAPANTLFVNAAGLIGIGSSTPVQELSVVGDGYFTGGLGIGVSTSTAGALETSGKAYFGDTFSAIGTGTSTIPNGDFAVGTTDFVVTKNGRVGIGTTSPSKMLSVAGTLAVADASTFNGQLSGVFSSTEKFQVN
ncbi:hypothetical protein HYW53_00005, partial [Candidatus Giovannonibacteria bacterium]|nr:hypothetical protein [Candidatus Giovannonibacteria bacterium]